MRWGKVGFLSVYDLLPPYWESLHLRWLCVFHLLCTKLKNDRQNARQKTWTPEDLQNSKLFPTIEYLSDVAPFRLFRYFMSSGSAVTSKVSAYFCTRVKVSDGYTPRWYKVLLMPNAESKRNDKTSYYHLVTWRRKHSSLSLKGSIASRSPP